MGAWVLDYVAAWAGDSGYVRHSNIQYRFPAFDGDLTLLDGRGDRCPSRPHARCRSRHPGGHHDQPGRLHHGQGPRHSGTAELAASRQPGRAGRIEPGRADRTAPWPPSPVPLSSPNPVSVRSPSAVFLADVGALHATSEAIAFHEGGRPELHWTYAELASQARRFAKALVAAGTDKGTRVALLMGNRPEWVVGALVWPWPAVSSYP